MNDITLSADDFIDTTIIVYMFDDRNPEKQQRADKPVRKRHDAD